MKFIQISDMHLVKEGELIHGVNPAKNLKKALKHILKHHPKVKFIALTGDLTHNGDKEAYRLLKDIIKDYPIPIFPIVGNHDNRENFWHYFPKFKSGKFVQYSKVINKRAFLFLDTLKEGIDSGHMNKERFNWLEKKLEKHKNKELYIFMHHHPIFVDMPPMDNIFNFKSAKKFWKIVGKYPNVKHIFFGHIHRNFEAMHKGIKLSSTNSSSFQISYMPDEPKEFLILDEPPTYSIIKVKKDAFKVHNSTFLKDKKREL